MDVASCDIVEGHTRKGLQILGSNDPMRPIHRQTLVIPDSGQARINLLLLLVRHTQPFRDGSRELFNRGCRRSHPHRLSNRDNGSDGSKWSDGRTLLMSRTVFFPMLDNGSSFFDLIFTYISLLNLVVISARSKHLLKKKKKEASTDEVNTYFFFPQSHGCAGQRQKAPV